VECIHDVLWLFLQVHSRVPEFFFIRGFWRCSIVLYEHFTHSVKNCTVSELWPVVVDFICCHRPMSYWVLLQQFSVEVMMLFILWAYVPLSVAKGRIQMIWLVSKQQPHLEPYKRFSLMPSRTIHVLIDHCLCLIFFNALSFLVLEQVQYCILLLL